MYGELIKRLRCEECLPYSALRTMREAADAIEELSAIREEQKAQIITMAAEIEELSKDRDNWKATAKEEREEYWHWFDQYQKDVPR